MPLRDGGFLVRGKNVDRVEESAEYHSKGCYGIDVALAAAAQHIERGGKKKLTVMRATETNRMEIAKASGLEIWGRPSATVVNTKKEMGAEMAATAMMPRTLPRIIMTRGVRESTIKSKVWLRNSL